MSCELRQLVEAATRIVENAIIHYDVERDCTGSRAQAIVTATRTAREEFERVFDRLLGEAD